MKTYHSHLRMTNVIIKLLATEFHTKQPNSSYIVASDVFGLQKLVLLKLMQKSGLHSQSY